MTPEFRRVLEHADRVNASAGEVLTFAETVVCCLIAGMPVPPEKLIGFAAEAASQRKTLTKQRAAIEALYLA